MIEIIREEEWEHTQEKALPKDIRQMGRPDIGDRIYVEDQAYHFLHRYDDPREKTAYVLLGKFENYSGRQCTFVEAVIRLEEIAFEGELPLWNDNTWAYIYKQLRREYDNMVIVGWALDIKGQLAGITARMEALHQSNFGGAHQILFLMDSLEGEEAFYGSRNGRMSRREGFYIYYDKNQQQNLSQPVKMEEKQEEEINENPPPEDEKEWERQAEERAARRDMEEKERQSEGEEKAKGEKWTKREFGEHFFRENSPARSGNYRKQVMEREERRGAPSFATSFVLLAVVCLLGVTVYTNYQKMNAMEETLAQINGGRTAATEQQESGEVTVETVVGNVTKQDDTAEGQTSETTQTNGAGTGTNGDETAAANGDGTVTTNEEGTGTGGTAANGTGTESGGATTNGDGTASGGTAANGDGTVAGNTATGNEASAGGTASQNTSTESETATETGTALTEAQTYLNQGYYVVQKGDTLVAICKKIYQTTAMLEKLCETNDIEDQDAIYAGQKLILPN